MKKKHFPDEERLKVLYVQLLSWKKFFWLPETGLEMIWCFNGVQNKYFSS